MSGEGKSDKNGNNTIDAYRVWRIKTNSEERQRLRQLYVRLSSAVRQACKTLRKKHGDAFRENPDKFRDELVEEAAKTSGLPKRLFYYAAEWYKMLASARRQSRKRTRFTPPPIALLIKVVCNGERIHGATNAATVLDVTKGMLRVPSAGITIRLKPSAVRAALEDIKRFPDLKLTLQVTGKGRLRLVAHRVVKQIRWNGTGRLAVIAIDMNSNHGLYAMAFAFDGGAKLLVQRVFKPPNTTLLRLLAAIMTSYSEVKNWYEAVQRFRQQRDVRRLQRGGRGSAVEEALRIAERLKSEMNLPPERAERIARQALRKVKKVNEDWIRATLKEVRVLVRKLRDQGYTVVLVADVPQAESLKGSELQRTLLRAARRLENLALYEGAKWFKPENNVSGKQCPLCGSWGVEVMKRCYRCPKCGLTWGRDWAAAFNSVKLFLKACDAERQLEALSKWLSQHPKAPTHGLRDRPGH